jgi:hypothetical protein
MTFSLKKTPLRTTFIPIKKPSSTNASASPARRSSHERRSFANDIPAQKENINVKNV